MTSLPTDAAILAPIVFVAWLSAACINLASGWRETSAVGGSWWRLLWVSGTLGLLGILPVAAGAAVAFQGHDAQPRLDFMIVATLVALYSCALSMQPPVWLQGTRERLPRVEDPAFLARVADLAGRMGVAVPFMRMLPSASGSQSAMAWVGTLQAPQLVVTDGILRRLSSAECDAIVAHELGHVANGSLWLLAAVVPAGSAVATIASAFLPPMAALGFGLAFLVGLRRLVSRPVELDCDRRAAQAIGFRETIAALAKIHAVNPLPNTGLVSQWTFATATHPSRDVRLAALTAGAPEDDRSATSISFEALQRHRLASRVALTIWFLVLAGTPWLVLAFPNSLLASLPIWIVAATPTLLILLVQRRQIAMTRRRLGRRWGWQPVLIALAFILAHALLFLASTRVVADAFPGWDFGKVIALAMAALILADLTGSLIWLYRSSRKTKLRTKVAQAIQVHDFPRAIEIGKAAGRRLERDPLTRYNVALAQAVCGDRAVAMTELERLWQEKPGLPLAALLLGNLLLDADRAEQALSVSQETIARLPDDPSPQVIAARALRRLGCLHDAEVACWRARQLAPDDGSTIALSAALALDRSELTRAQSEVELAQHKAPGDCFVLAVAAEIALSTQALDSARALVAQTLETIRTNPLIFLSVEAAHLEQVLSEIADC